MKKILFYSLLVACVACAKEQSSQGPTPPPDTKEGFNWSTLTTQKITLHEASDILNEAGDTIAVNLQAGTYNIPKGVNRSLSIQSHVASKATDVESKISFPSTGSYATLMAEDLFPYKGDYDMNDVVVGFRVDYILDNQYPVEEGVRMVKTIKFNIMPRALGTPTELIGLAVNLQWDEQQYRAVTLSRSNRNTANLEKLFTVNEQGVEPGLGRDIVIPLSGDLRQQFTSYEDGLINTFNKLNFNKGKGFTVNITLDKEIDFNELQLFGSDPKKVNLDLFVVVEKRGKEIHLKGQLPTSKFDQTYFKNLKDFVTPDHFVWMMVVDKPIRYATEMTNIQNAYPDFAKWVENNGNNMVGDWYNSYNPESVYKEYNR